MFRELTMIDVKEVLRRWQRGQGHRTIAAKTGVDRKTARRYASTAEECGLPKDRELTDDEVHEVAQRVRARPLADPSAEWEEVARHRVRIEKWLNQDRPLKLTKVHTLLKRDGLTAGYQTLRRFAIRELGWGLQKSTVRLDDAPPGQEAQVDFGRMGFIPDEATGKRRTLHALIITLAFSRLSFVWPTFRQTTEAVIEGLEQAWAFFAAMPVVLLPDNATSMVVKPDPYAPQLTETFGDYVQARGLFVDPARVASPKDKARVENQVPYVRESWYDGEKFTGLADARQAARHWCEETAGGRIHGTTRKVPREVYAVDEKPHMRAAPDSPYDVPLFADAKVHPDHHVQVARALYSVPHPYLHREVHVRADSKLVRIYFNTELIKMHERQPPGGRSTDPADYPPGKSLYATRSIDGIIGKARTRGEHVGIYVERILAGPLPWARMRAAYALLRLCDKYGDGRVESVCQSALSFDVVDVHRVASMLKRSAKPPKASDDQQGKLIQLPLPMPRFARSPEQFATRVQGGDVEEGK
jgi:transposase